MPEEQNHKRLFTSGDYQSHFLPDEQDNPFSRLYAEKKKYIVDYLHKDRLRILDLGGGYGRLSSALSAEHDVTLSDLSLAMLRQALRSFPGMKCRLTNCDAEYLPFKSEQFDLVLALDLLCHLPNPHAALLEIRRVLRPGGRLIMDSSNRSPWWMFAYPGYVNPSRSPVRFIRTMWGGGVLPDWQGRVRHYHQAEFYRFSDQSGFQIMQTKDFGPWYCPKWHLAVSQKVNLAT